MLNLKLLNNIIPESMYLKFVRILFLDASISPIKKITLNVYIFEHFKMTEISYLSIITGSEGVSFLLPQLFLSQHRLRKKKKKAEIIFNTALHNSENTFTKIH